MHLLLSLLLCGHPGQAAEPGEHAPLATGLVLDARGRPAAGVPIDNLGITTTGTTSRTDVVTDEEGRFSVPWPVDVRTRASSPVLMAWLQARTPAGESSAPALATVLPAEITLRLRPPASVLLHLEGMRDGEVDVKAILRRNEAVGAPGLVLHDGPLPVHRGDVLLEGAIPGRLTVTVGSGAIMGYTEVPLVAGEQARATVPLMVAGDLGLSLPWDLQGAACLFTPGTQYDARSGFPTVASCRDLEPGSTRYEDFVSGEQQLVIKTDDGRIGAVRLTVYPETWCGYELTALPQVQPGGIVGVVLPKDDSPAVIEQVLPDTPAERAGLRVGDEVRTVNGQPVSSGLGALVAILGADATEEVRLVVSRNTRDRAFSMRKTSITPPPEIQPTGCGERPWTPSGAHGRALPYPLPPSPRGR